MSLITGAWHGRDALGAKRQERMALADLNQVTDDEQQKLSQAFSPPEFPIALHPYLGFVLVGSGQYFPVPVQDLNVLGFSPYAGGSLVREENSKRMVIGIFGGSVAHNLAWSSALETLRKRLSVLPAFNGKDIVFTVPALGGYKEPQQLIALAYLLNLGAHFDAIITLDGFNEVVLTYAENVRDGVAPSYPRNWHMIAGNNRDPVQLLKIGRIATLLTIRATLARWFDAPPLRWSLSAGLLWHGIDHIVATQLYRARLSMQSPSEIKNFSITGPRQQYVNTEDIFRDLAQIWARGTLQIDRLASANHIRSFHFLQPNQYVPGSKTLSSEEQKIAVIHSSWAATGVVLGYPYLKEEGELLVRQGVHFSDLTDIFRNYPETIYIDDCCHVNIRGNEILAEAIADEILREW